MITLESHVSEFRNLAYATARCGESITWLDTLDCSMKEALAIYLADESIPTGWAVSGLWRLHGSLATGVQVELAKKIKDPMTAYRLHKHLNNPEVSAILFPLYDGQLEVDD